MCTYVYAFVQVSADGSRRSRHFSSRYASAFAQIHRPKRTRMYGRWKRVYVPVCTCTMYRYVNTAANDGPVKKSYLENKKNKKLLLREKKTIRMYVGNTPTSRQTERVYTTCTTVRAYWTGTYRAAVVVYLISSHAYA